MKLITLNTWGGRVKGKLFPFFKNHADDIDVFCLQEVFNNLAGQPSHIKPDAVLDLYNQIKKILPKFNAYLGIREENEENQAIFVRKNIEVQELGDHFVYRWKNAWDSNQSSTFGILLQWVKLKDKNLLIANLHGYHTPNDKRDDPNRIEQAKNIRTFLDQHNGPIILCGDFNMDPDTKSMAIIEKGMRNLVTDYRITSTRTPLYRHYKDGTRFADYILISPEIVVKNFKVLPHKVSDHSPLYVEFE